MISSSRGAVRGIALAVVAALPLAGCADDSAGERDSLGVQSPADESVDLADGATPEAATDPPGDNDTGAAPPPLDMGTLITQIPGRTAPLVASNTWSNVVFATDVETDVLAVDLVVGDVVRRWQSHHSDITDMAVTADDTVVSGDFDGAVRVWDVNGGGQVGDPFADHTAEVISVAGGELDSREVVLSGGMDGIVRIWDVETREEIADPLNHPAPVASIELTTMDGRNVAVTASDTKLHVWDLATGEQITEPFVGHLSNVNQAVVAEVDNQLIVVSGSSDGSVRRWDLRTGEQIGQSMAGHEGDVLTVAVGELGGRPVIASGSGDPDRTVRLWDLTNGTEVGDPITSHSFAVRSVVFTDADGRPVLASAGLAIHVSALS